jgi:hypothetical protein
VTDRRRVLAGVSVRGRAGWPYLPTLLALREGPLLEQAVRALEIVPEVLVVNATGRDHPRRAGLALPLGAVLELPTVGVTTRPLVAQGAWPADQRGATTPTAIGSRPLASEQRIPWLGPFDGSTIALLPPKASGPGRGQHLRALSCQQVVSSDPTRGLASQRCALSGHLSEQG